MLFNIHHQHVFGQEDFYFNHTDNVHLTTIQGSDVLEAGIKLDDIDSLVDDRSWTVHGAVRRKQLRVLSLLPRSGTPERWNSVNCSKTAWLDIERVLGLPLYILAELTSTHPSATAWSRYLSSDETCYGLTFGHKAFSIGISCVVIYNTKTHLTFVLLNSREHQMIPTILNNTQHDTDYSSIPSCLPMLLLDLVLNGLETTGYEYDMQFVGLQESLRTSPWIESQRDDAEDTSEDLSAKKIALTHLLQQFEAMHQQFSLLKENIQAVLYYHDTCANHQNLNEKETRMAIEIRERLEYTQRRAERLQAVYVVEVAQVQANIQTVYSMVGQTANLQNYQAAQASIEIAELTRKDSADMRVIAAATLLFLPATFVATLFSTSFFNFQPDNDGFHVSSLYWIYWVVTITLTALVWAGWSYTTRSVIQRFSRKSTNSTSKAITVRVLKSSEGPIGCSTV